MSMAVTEKGVMVVTEKDAPAIFQDRSTKVFKALDAMPGLRSANITLRRDRAAGDVEFYTLNAACEATSLGIALEAMIATLETMSNGLMHIVLRAPVAEIAEEVMNPLPPGGSGAAHYMGYVRARISNQRGERAAAQRQNPELVPYGTIKATGPDVV